VKEPRSAWSQRVAAGHLAESLAGEILSGQVSGEVERSQWEKQVEAIGSFYLHVASRERSHVSYVDGLGDLNRVARSLTRLKWSAKSFRIDIVFEPRRLHSFAQLMESRDSYKSAYIFKSQGQTYLIPSGWLMSVVRQREEDRETFQGDKYELSQASIVSRHVSGGKVVPLRAFLERENLKQEELKSSVLQGGQLLARYISRDEIFYGHRPWREQAWLSFGRDRPFMRKIIGVRTLCELAGEFADQKIFEQKCRMGVDLLRKQIKEGDSSLELGQWAAWAMTLMSLRKLSTELSPDELLMVAGEVLSFYDFRRRLFWTSRKGINEEVERFSVGMALFVLAELRDELDSEKVDVIFSSTFKMHFQDLKESEDLMRFRWFGEAYARAMRFFPKGRAYLKRMLDILSRVTPTDRYVGVERGCLRGGLKTQRYIDVPNHLSALMLEATTRVALTLPLQSSLRTSFVKASSELAYCVWNQQYSRAGYWYDLNTQMFEGAFPFSVVDPRQRIDLQSHAVNGLLDRYRLVRQ
jgi:hypothetical protein